MTFELEILFKLFIALLFGMLIGVDRKLKQKPIGLKTCSVISIASCLITIVSIQSFEEYASPTYHAIDPMRLAAQIVSGVGFLGAGVILHRKNDVISGLTSAALIWAASGLGIAVGAGFYFEAFFAVILLIVAVNFFPWILKSIGPPILQKKDIYLKITIDPDYKMEKLFQTMETKFQNLNHAEGINLKILDIKLKRLDNDNQKIDLRLSVSEEQRISEIYDLVKEMDYVLTVDVRSL